MTREKSWPVVTPRFLAVIHGGQFLANLLTDTQRHEGDKSVLAAIFLSSAELKPSGPWSDFVRHVVDKLFR